MKTVLITGSSGFVATKFINKYKDKYNIIQVSHLPKLGKYTLAEIANNNEIKESIDHIINLAGESINKRWTKNNKEKILSSRITTTNRIVEIFNNTTNKPHIINASAVGIYNFGGVYTDDTTIDYNSYANFSQEITKKWESVALNYRGKVAITRFAVILDKLQGAFPKMILPFKYSLGGVIGSGKQVFPWVSIDDVIQVLDMIISQDITSILNVASPETITNLELTQILAQKYSKKAWLNLPTWFVKTLFGQMGDELLLNGAHNYPDRLLKLGYKFKHITLSQYVAKAV